MRRGRVRILLVEDNATNQLVAQGILKKLGLRADAVANGVEALKALESIPYDLVLMDCQMPTMDGYEATTQIRHPGSGVLNPDVPIIAMTAHAMKGDREKCLQVGMNDYLAKPIDPAKLAEALDQWLPEGKDIGAQKSKEAPNNGQEEKSAAPDFDKNGLLERLMGDEEMADTILELFLEDIPLQIQGLKKFLDAGDAPGTERQAHTIKGASANVGGEALHQVAWAIEQAGKTGELDTARNLTTELEARFDRLKVAIQTDA
jgi:CheY-like chemotaxis protein/HPt (histidine-containing phosphotransfer) domain-containing protein